MRQLAGVVLLILAGCVSPESNITMYPVTSGGTLGQHLESRSSAVVLVLDPADLVVCGNHVSRWMEWGREHPGQLLIVLSKVPSQADRKQLLLFRVRHDAVLQGSRKFARITTPHEYLVENGQVVLSEPVPVGSPESPLLKALERGQVAGMAKSRRT